MKPGKIYASLLKLRKLYRSFIFTTLSKGNPYEKELVLQLQGNNKKEVKDLYSPKILISNL